MPELPEVETIRRELEPEILGLKIVSIELFWEKTLKKISAAEFNRILGGAVIIGLERRGKYLIFKTDRGGGFVVHFRMTGSIVTGSEGDDLPSYCRALIKMDNNLSLFFVDIRKFGSIEMLESCQPKLDKLGPEPLEDYFTPEILRAALVGRKSPVKAVLLDQQRIAGIGNMYADEALFQARINPLEPAQNLDQRQILNLHNAIQFVLRRAIEREGATVSAYARPGGESGRAQDDFCVAHKRGCKCLRCNTPVERIVVCQRGTYFCPVCQPRN